MTAGSPEDLERAEGTRVLDRAVVGRDADLRGHVPHVDSVAGVSELIQEPAKHRRLHRVRTQLGGVLGRRGQAVPVPFGVAFGDLETRVAQAFRALLAGALTG